MKVFLMNALLVILGVLLIWIFIAPGCVTFRTPDAEMKKKFETKGVHLFTATQVIQGKHLHYASTGDDTLPILLFVHGTPGSWDAFSEYMEDPDLLKRFRMISVDRPGFGYSDFGKAEDLQQQSALMSPLLWQLKNDKPLYLVGHSLGGPMIVKLAADNPGLCSGLIMISASVDPAEEKPEKWRPWLFNTPLHLIVPGAFAPSNEELWYLKKDLVKLKGDFQKIDCPVYFIHGAADTWVPPGNVEYAKKLLVHAKRIDVTMLSGGNHFIPWTRFNEIKEVLLKLQPAGADSARATVR